MQEKSLSEGTENRIFRFTVKGFDSDLNKVLNGVYFDYKTKRVFNRVKAANDKLVIDSVRLNSAFRDEKRNLIKLNTPIVIHYKFFCDSKRKDRTNVASAFDKSFEDGLQKAGILKNDGWNDVLNVTYDFALDKQNPRVEIVIEEVDGDYYSVFFDT